MTQVFDSRGFAVTQATYDAFVQASARLIETIMRLEESHEKIVRMWPGGEAATISRKALGIYPSAPPGPGIACPNCGRPLEKHCAVCGPSANEGAQS